MAKTEVYSWRLSPETKSALEETARQQQASVSELLERIVGEWLACQEKSEADEAEQRRLHAAALKTVGTIRGDDPNRASNAKALLRAKLARRRAD
jgi:hypothetical protein